MSSSNLTGKTNHEPSVVDYGVQLYSIVEIANVVSKIFENNGLLVERLNWSKIDPDDDWIIDPTKVKIKNKVICIETYGDIIDKNEVYIFVSTIGDEIEIVSWFRYGFPQNISDLIEYLKSDLD